MGAQWFPKLGVWWHGAWNCHQFHATTEFFADFGTFDVKLTVPQNEVVGASGVPTGEVNNNDGTKTLTFRGEDIHDFAWTASPNYHRRRHVHGSMGTVKIRLLCARTTPIRPTATSTSSRRPWRSSTSGIGPYPYKTVTVIDPEPGSEMGGMEYPTLFTGDTTWYEPTHHSS